MMKTFLILATAGLLLASCNGNKKSTSETTTPAVEVAATSANEAASYAGTYVGTFPAADGPGVKTTITLKKDNSFELISEYLEKGDATFKEYGTYTVENNILTLTNGEDKHYYAIGENILTALNQDKQPASGETANLYVLKKQ